MGKRLKLSLEQAKYDIVLPLSEDYFLKSKVDFKWFSYFVDLISENKEIDHIRLLRYRVLWKAKISEYNYLEKIEPITKHRFLLIPGLWKKHTLLKYLKVYEDAFMTEKLVDFDHGLGMTGFIVLQKDLSKNLVRFIILLIVDLFLKVNGCLGGWNF